MDLGEGVRGGPRFVRLGKAVRYRWFDVEEFIGASLRASTADPGRA